MRNKKSQIGLFLILGLVLVIAGIFVFYMAENERIGTQTETTTRVSLTKSQINVFVESCIENIGNDAIFKIGQGGGYIQIHKYQENDIKNLAFYFYINKNIAPKKEIIENRISNYIDEQLSLCLRNFEYFKEQGIEIEYATPRTITTINPNSISFKLDLPIKIKQGNSYISMSEFAKVLENVRLGTIINSTQNLLEEQMKDFDSICLNCIINLGIQSNLSFNVHNIGDSTLLFTIIDNNTIINELPYEFIFANKYRQVACNNIPNDWPDDKISNFLQECIQSQIKSYNYDLTIEPIPDQNLVVGQQFLYHVKAKGIKINFSDYTELFDINKSTGLIDFMPSIEDAGEYTIWLSVSDSLGNEEYSSFKLKIYEKII